MIGFRIAEEAGRRTERLQDSLSHRCGRNAEADGRVVSRAALQTPDPSPWPLHLATLVLGWDTVNAGHPVRKFRRDDRQSDGLFAVPSRDGVTRSPRFVCFRVDESSRLRNLARMARQLRVEDPGAIYHVMNRGDRREPVFKDDLDRQRFLLTLGQACAKTAWQVHAFRLMENHFQLVLETPLANLVAGMKWILGTYPSCFNRRRNEDGEKVKKARRLRGETTMTLAWIAGRLNRGAAGHAAHCLRQAR
jgi:REP element-mobilizing transposase RayT